MNENENKEIQEETTPEVKEETNNNQINKGGETPKEEYIKDKINEEPFNNNNNNNTPPKKDNKVLIIVIIIVAFLALVGLAGSIAMYFVIPNFVNKTANDVINKANDIIDNQTDNGNVNTDDIVDTFNNIVENTESKANNNALDYYIGTQDGDDVKEMLDEVVNVVKKDSKHTITIIYNDVNTTDTAEITSLKDKFDDSKEYEVSMDYDSNKYINKITITDR